jgi:hypothetical protein
MNQDILISLDALLDTRLATLFRMNPKQAETILFNGYRNRESDQWSAFSSEIDQAAYQEAYKKRDIDTLKAARPTSIAPVINQITNTLGKAAIQAPMIERIKVDVNVYPYRMDDALKEMIAGAVNEWVSVDTIVSVVDMPPSDITPMYLDRHYAAMILYDFDEWLGLHHEQLMECPIPTVTVIAPALYLDKKPTEMDLRVDGTDMVSAFAALEMALLEYMSLTIMDAKYFSLIEL